MASAQAGTVVKVQVGAEQASPGGIFQYSPATIVAANGTVVTFQFSGAPGNHTVTQSSFAAPCTPLANGFDSGFVFQSTAPATPSEWNLTITNDQTPIWFFCQQLLPSPHCASGMVGVINVKPGANSLAAFQAAAKGTSTSGQTINGLVGVGASASALPVAQSGVTLFPTATAPASGGGGGGSGGGNSSAPAASGPSGSPSGKPAGGGAVALGFNSNLLVVLGGALAGAALVL
jgi:plastocyanin